MFRSDMIFQHFYSSLLVYERFHKVILLGKKTLQLLVIRFYNKIPGLPYFVLM
jgi:hypothetical protein